MDPDHLFGLGAIAALSLASGGLRLKRAPTPEQLEQMRIEREAAIAAKRAASPDVAKAEAKRKRKADKLRALSNKSPQS